MSKLQQKVKDREARHAAVHGVAKSQTRLGDRTTTYLIWGFLGGLVVKNPPAMQETQV